MRNSLTPLLTLIVCTRLLGQDSLGVTRLGFLGYDQISLRSVALSETEPYAIVAAGTYGLRVIEISQLGLPLERAVFDTPHSADEVVVVGEYAYVADQGAGLRIIDIRNPIAPVEVGAYDTPGLARGLTVVGHYAFVADGLAGLRIVDVNDSAHPVAVGSLSVSYAMGIAVDGNYAYIVGGYGMVIVDVSNPSSPMQQSMLELPMSSTFRVVATGGYAYIAGGEYGVRIVDVSDPVEPVEVGRHDTPGVTVAVAKRGSHLLLADHTAGMRVIDIADPAHPAEVGYYVPAWTVGGVAVIGDIAFTGEGFGFGVYNWAAASGVAERRELQQPRMVTLHPVYPNPFNGATTLAYDLPFSGRVSLRVFDLLGCEVAVLEWGIVPAGNHVATFDGSGLASGLYIAKLETSGFVQAQKLLLIK